MNGLGAELAEFVLLEWVVVMMSVPLNRVSAFAFLALFIRPHPHRMGGHSAMGFNPTKPASPNSANA
jgi:hypothetical protein